MTKLERQLAELLMDVINQSCQEVYDREKQECYVHHWHMHDYEKAIFLLEDLGLAKEMKRGKYKGLWRLNWAKLPKEED